MKKKTDEEKSFHREYGEFTKKLHRLMNEFPTMPVVIFDHAEPDGACLDCDVGYVHGRDGECREKIIAVYDAKKTAGGTDELPF